MKKTITHLILFSSLIVLTAGSLSADKVTTFSDLKQPTGIVLNDKYMYISENRTTIMVYEREGFKFIKTFGEAGEGPKKFNTFAGIIPLEDKLMINSMAKISYWTFTGEFVSEKRSESGGMATMLFYPLKNEFIGMNIGPKDGIQSYFLNKYDNNLKKIKELYQVPMTAKSRKRLMPGKQIPGCYFARKNIAYVAAKPGFIIEMLNPDGEVIKTIEKKKFKKRKFTSENRKVYLDLIVKQAKISLEVAKSFIEFEDYFPAIMSIFGDKNNFYVITWEVDILKEGSAKFYKYDLDGNELDEFVLKFAMQENMQPYPAGFYDGNLYQLIENDDEEWELFVTPLKSK